MALYKGTSVANGANIIFPSSAGAVVALAMSHTFQRPPLLNDVIEISCLPNGAKLVDAILVSDDLDSNAAPTIQFDVGVLSGAFESEDARVCGAELFSATQIGRAGGVARMAVKEGFRVPVSNTDRGIGLKVTAVATTFQVGTVNLILLYAAA